MKIYLPYTIIDVGWWFQISIASIPSGRTQYALTVPGNTIAGGENVASAMTDLRDIGHYVARIIADSRTLNKAVLTYNEVLSQNEAYELFERLSGEKIERTYVCSVFYSLNICRLMLANYRIQIDLRRGHSGRYLKCPSLCRPHGSLSAVEFPIYALVGNPWRQQP